MIKTENGDAPAEVTDLGAKQYRAKMKGLFNTALQAGREGDVDGILDLMAGLQAEAKHEAERMLNLGTGDEEFKKITDDCFLALCALLPKAGPVVRGKIIGLLSQLHYATLPSAHLPYAHLPYPPLSPGPSTD